MWAGNQFDLRQKLRLTRNLALEVPPVFHCPGRQSGLQAPRAVLNAESMIAAAPPATGPTVDALVAAAELSFSEPLELLTSLATQAPRVRKFVHPTLPYPSCITPPIGFWQVSNLSGVPGVRRGAAAGAVRALQHGRGAHRGVRRGRRLPSARRPGQRHPAPVTSATGTVRLSPRHTPRRIHTRPKHVLLWCSRHHTPQNTLHKQAHSTQATCSLQSLSLGRLFESRTASP